MTNKESKDMVRKCSCPYCDEEVNIAESPFCQPCGATLRYCASCQIAVPKEAEVCPECGGKLEGK